MTRYVSVGTALALAALCACSPAPAHPDGWTQTSTNVWTTTSGAGPERFTLTSTASQDALSDLASSQAVDTVQRYPGSKMLQSVPFSPCPGEAGLATYRLPHAQVLEVAFTVYNGEAIVAQYERPASVGDSPAALAALRQAVCYAL